MGVAVNLKSGCWDGLMADGRIMDGWADRLTDKTDRQAVDGWWDRDLFWGGQPASCRM